MGPRNHVLHGNQYGKTSFSAERGDETLLMAVTDRYAQLSGASLNYGTQLKRISSAFVIRILHHSIFSGQVLFLMPNQQC